MSKRQLLRKSGQQVRPFFLSFILFFFLALTSVTRTRPRFFILALGSIFKYVLAVTRGSQFRTFYQRTVNSGTSNVDEGISFFLSHSSFPFFFHLTTTLVDLGGREEGGGGAKGKSFKRIFLGYRIRSRSPRRRNKSKTPRWLPPLGGYVHEVVMDWRDWRLGRP